jgi:hypothetical protein
MCGICGAGPPPMNVLDTPTISGLGSPLMPPLAVAGVWRWDGVGLFSCRVDVGDECSDPGTSRLPRLVPLLTELLAA